MSGEVYLRLERGYRAPARKRLALYLIIKYEQRAEYAQAARDEERPRLADAILQIPPGHAMHYYDGPDYFDVSVRSGRPT